LIKDSSANFDLPFIGWWNSVLGGAAATGHTAGGFYNGLANGTGTSASETIVAGGANAFVPGVDVLDFASAAWGSDGTVDNPANQRHGLTYGNLHSTIGTFDTISQAILPSAGVVAANSVAAGTNLILLDGVYTGGANQVAQTLIGVNGNVHFAGSLSTNESAHMLVAYNDGSGNTHIADLDLFDAIPNRGGGGLRETNELDVHVSDMVQLTGVSFASFQAAANSSVHFVASVF
jgi:hypothetical protein